MESIIPQLNRLLQPFGNTAFDRLHYFYFTQRPLEMILAPALALPCQLPPGVETKSQPSNSRGLISCDHDWEVSCIKTNDAEHCTSIRLTGPSSTRSFRLRPI
jgi:hypothetical protein